MFLRKDRMEEDDTQIVVENVSVLDLQNTAIERMRKILPSDFGRRRRRFQEDTEDTKRFSHSASCVYKLPYSAPMLRCLKWLADSLSSWVAGGQPGNIG